MCWLYPPCARQNVRLLMVIDGREIWVEERWRAGVEEREGGNGEGPGREGGGKGEVVAV